MRRRRRLYQPTNLLSGGQANDATSYEVLLASSVLDYFAKPGVSRALFSDKNIAKKSAKAKELMTAVVELLLDVVSDEAWRGMAADPSGGDSGSSAEEDGEEAASTACRMLYTLQQHVFSEGSRTPKAGNQAFEMMLDYVHKLLTATHGLLDAAVARSEELGGGALVDDKPTLHAHVLNVLGSSFVRNLVPAAATGLSLYASNIEAASRLLWVAKDMFEVSLGVCVFVCVCVGWTGQSPFHSFIFFFFFWFHLG